MSTGLENSIEIFANSQVSKIHLRRDMYSIFVFLLERLLFYLYEIIIWTQMYTGFARPTALNHWERRCENILIHQTGVTDRYLRRHYSKIRRHQSRLEYEKILWYLTDENEWKVERLDWECVQWARLIDKLSDEMKDGEDRRIAGNETMTEECIFK